MSDIRYISLKEIRQDLEGFVRAIHMGQRFAVFKRTELLVTIGKVEGLRTLEPRHDSDRYAPELLDLVNRARLETRYNTKDSTGSNA
jgi:hypothetical protein